MSKISKRERQVLEHIALGLNTKTIAEKLFISIETVKSHRKKLLVKLEAKNAASLIFLSVKKGIMDPAQLSF